MLRLPKIDIEQFKADAPRMTLQQLSKKYGIVEATARNKCRILGVQFYTERKPNMRAADITDGVTYLTLEQAIAEQKQARKGA